MKEIKLSEHFTYKKLIRFTLPSVFMMMFMSVYGIVDGLFVSNLAGEVAFKAINIVMPFIMIVTTVGFMLGSGGTAIVANARGAGDIKRANSCFSLFVYTTVIASSLVAIASLIFIRQIAALLGAEGEILEAAVQYARIILIAVPAASLQFFFQSFFVAAEKPKLGLFVIILAGVMNMVLDALLVTLLPLEYKLIGAAVATAASQTVGGLVPVIYFASKNSTPFRLGKTEFKPRAIMQACYNGSSEFMSNISMNLVGILYNLQLLKYAGDDGVAAYGVMMYVGMIFAAVFIGYSIGVAPVISFHDGAENSEEKRSLLRKSLIIITVISVAMLVAGELLSEPLSALFVGYNAQLMALTVSGMRIFSFCFLFMGIAIFGSSFFTALGDGLTSAVISFLRTLVFQLAAVLTLPVLLGGVDGIWLSVVLADLLATLLTVVFIIAKKKKFKY